MKKLDLYIIKKFLGTFFFTIILLLAIAIVIDISEKIDSFVHADVTLLELIEKYYFNFVLFYGSMFMPLVVFLAAILFTSKMAKESEIIAYLTAGISFNRLLYPYFISATVLASLSFYLAHFVLPDSNKERLEFEKNELGSGRDKRVTNIHRQIRKGEYVYIKSFQQSQNKGTTFSIEKFEGTKLIMKLSSRYINFYPKDSTYKLRNWKKRIITDTKDKIYSGIELDTVFAFFPKDLTPKENVAETMVTGKLNEFIAEQKFRGSENLSNYLVESYRRTSMPASTYILTMIAVSLSFRRKRGGTGMNIAIGMGLMVLYIFFMRIADTFAIKDDFPPMLAVWMPNIIFGIIAIILYNNARK